MSAYPPIPNVSYPELSLTGSVLPDGFDAHTFDASAVTQKWFTTFQAAVANPDALVDVFVPKSTGAQVWWRDMLALTWDFRTFIGPEAIHKFATDRLTNKTPDSQLQDLKLILQDSESGLAPHFSQVTPDLVWIMFFFTFNTTNGVGSGIGRLCPVGAKTAAEFNDGAFWKAQTIYTNLEGLKGHPELTGPRRDPKPNHGLWESGRKREIECIGEDGKPVVIIIGAGQSGLGLAARLKALGLKSLIIEQNARVGDNWRSRYDSLCLHDPVYADHMPYLPFPPNWPVYSPAIKLANWLEHYSEIMELNVWLSSKVTNVTQDPETGFWDITISRGVQSADGTIKEEIRHFKSIHQLVLGTGLGSGHPELPVIPGMDKFRANGGTILHSTEHKRAGDHVGKKVIVVGACTSGHDIAADFYNHGVDVTMFQRSSTYIMSTENGWNVIMNGIYSEDAPPTEVADRIAASFPHLSNIPLDQMKTQVIAQLDKELLDGLEKVGFRTNFGFMNTGYQLLAFGRAGGYYLDTGASGLVAEGKIKLKNDAQIKEFTETGILFDNGSELKADLVVFANGIGRPQARIASVLGPELAAKAKALWGFNAEGELNGAWRDMGIDRFWYQIGSLLLCRFYSRHIALQIKAREEGLFPGRYSLETTQ